MTRAPRNRLQVDERRAQLLALGLTLFGERSYESISIDDIAATAGISKGLLYHYFGSKRGFYVATVRAASVALIDAIEPDRALVPDQRVRRSLTGYFEFVERHASAYVALMRSGIGADEEVVAIAEEVRQAVVDRMLEGLGLDTPRPAFRLAARAWVGAVEASSLDWLERPDLPRERVIELLLRVLYATLLAASELDPEGPKLPIPR